LHSSVSAASIASAARETYHGTPGSGEPAGRRTMNLSLLAALGSPAVFGVWYAKFAPTYLKPRPDGRPG
jgi:hypothetical protein